MTESKRKTTQTALMEAGFRILSRNPGANLADIAQAAGVTRATLHRYFPNRESLVAALIHRAVEEIDEALEIACENSSTAGEVLMDSMAALIPLGDRYGFLTHEALAMDEIIETEFQRQQADTHRWVEAARLEGFFDPSIPTAWIVASYDSLLYAAWESVRQEEITNKQAISFAWRTLIKGVGPS